MAVGQHCSCGRGLHSSCIVLGEWDELVGRNWQETKQNQLYFNKINFKKNSCTEPSLPCASVGCRRCASALPEGLFPRCQWHWLWLLLPPWEISFLYDFICFFSAVLGLCGRVGFSLAAASRGRSLVGAHGLLFEAEHRLQGMRASVVAARGLSSCGSQTREHRLNS